MSRHAFNRRRFLTTSAGVAASTFVFPNLLLRGQNAAGKRLNLAVIGANGKGQGDTGNVTYNHNIVALVDVDKDRLEDAAKTREKHHEKGGLPKPPAPKLYQDFRKMLDECHKELDGVIVSTPDHTHFVAAMWALGYGKHICVQKPLCNTIWEVRELHKAAKAAGVITQMGNQGRTMEGQRLAKEWIEQGAIGTLKSINLWTNRPIWPQGPIKTKTAQAPSNLDWDLWLAQEASEPYFEYEEAVTRGKKVVNSVHPFAWRGWWQFGSGALGDMGCHIMDATFSILDQAIPVKIEVESSEVTSRTAPMWSTLKYHFAPGKNNPEPLVVTWQDGEKDGMPNKPQKPAMLADLSEEGWGKASSGMIFQGTEAVVYEGDAYCKSPAIYPLANFNGVKLGMRNGTITKTEPRSPVPDNPQGEWAHCIVNGGTPSSNFDYSCPLTEFVLLGNLAIRSGQTISWDKENMKVTNLEAANQFIKRPVYRPGWMKA